MSDKSIVTNKEVSALAMKLMMFIGSEFPKVKGDSFLVSTFHGVIIGEIKTWLKSNDVETEE